MRSLTLFRPLATFVALLAALASPTVAVAHGIAHERMGHRPAHASPASEHTIATDVSVHALVVVPTDDEDAPHMGLHDGCQAWVSATLIMVLAGPPVVIPIAAPASTGRAVARPRIGDVHGGCALPADQPRAPPIR